MTPLHVIEIGGLAIGNCERDGTLHPCVALSGHGERPLRAGSGWKFADPWFMELSLIAG